jgi:hypothetical protein
VKWGGKPRPAAGLHRQAKADARSDRGRAASKYSARPAGGDPVL